MKRHEWYMVDKDAIVITERCRVCGAERMSPFPYMRKTPAMLDGMRQKHCPGFYHF